MKWASRWDTYLTMSDVQIHWFSIVNSVVVVFFLSGEFCPSRTVPDRKVGASRGVVMATEPLNLWTSLKR